MGTPTGVPLKFLVMCVSFGSIAYVAAVAVRGSAGIGRIASRIKEHLGVLGVSGDVGRFKIYVAWACG